MLDRSTKSAKGEPNRGYPVGMFTTSRGLLLDLDEFPVDFAKKFSKELSLKEDLGDILAMKSSWSGQITLDFKPAYSIHLIFGKNKPRNHIQRILRRLEVLRIIEPMVAEFQAWESDLTLRVTDKNFNCKEPEFLFYIEIDGCREIIDEYLMHYKISNRIVKELEIFKR